MFYQSNTDSVVIPKEKGWYISYRTESGDEDYMKVDRQPKDHDDAFNMLTESDPDECYIKSRLCWSEIK